MHRSNLIVYSPHLFTLDNPDTESHMANINTPPDFRRFQAAIFDLDGTLVHSEHVWEMAKRKVVARYGFNPTQTLLDAHVGRGLDGFLDDVFGRPLTPFEQKDFGDQIGAIADALLPLMRTPVPGAADLLADLHKKGLRIAICSSSPRRHIISAIKMLGIENHIELLVSGAELQRGKPDPMPYQKTLEDLKLPGDSVCAFEDSVSGATSALAAGLTVFAIGNGCTLPSFDECSFRAEDFQTLLEM